VCQVTVRPPRDRALVRRGLPPALGARNPGRPQAALQRASSVVWLYQQILSTNRLEDVVTSRCGDTSTASPSAMDK
jgi:hypothetical protein